MDELSSARESTWNMIKKEATNQPQVMGSRPRYPRLYQMVPDLPVTVSYSAAHADRNGRHDNPAVTTGGSGLPPRLGSSPRPVRQKAVMDQKLNPRFMCWSYPM